MRIIPPKIAKIHIAKDIICPTAAPPFIFSSDGDCAIAAVTKSKTNIVTLATMKGAKDFKPFFRFCTASLKLSIIGYLRFGWICRSPQE